VKVFPRGNKMQNSVPIGYNYKGIFNKRISGSIIIVTNWTMKSEFSGKIEKIDVSMDVCMQLNVL
jgi:hypothetical protein